MILERLLRQALPEAMISDDLGRCQLAVAPLLSSKFEGSKLMMAEDLGHYSQRRDILTAALVEQTS